MAENPTPTERVALSAQDRLDLMDLAARYALRVDEGDIDAVVELFAGDGVMAMPDPPRSMVPAVERVGHDQMREALAAIFQVDVTVHALEGHVIDPGPDADTAYGVVACSAHHISRREGLPDRAVAGDAVWRLRYHDTYRRIDGRWRFARRHAVVGAIEIVPVRFLGPRSPKVN